MQSFEPKHTDAHACTNFCQVALSYSRHSGYFIASVVVFCPSLRPLLPSNRKKYSNIEANWINYVFFVVPKGYLLPMEDLKTNGKLCKISTKCINI